MHYSQVSKNIAQGHITNISSNNLEELTDNSAMNVHDSELLDSVAAIIHADAKEKNINKVSYKFYRFLFKLSISIFLGLFLYNKVDYIIKTTVQTIFSTERIEDPIIMDLLSHKVIERMKKIDQSGPLRYFDFAPAYSKYDHSLGVWVLLKRYNLSLKEQVAGLLHDSSHTIFSHVGDYLFEMPEGVTSYQDTIHLDYLEKQNVIEILKKYHLNLNDIVNKNKYRGLEQNLPNLCADRIEYILHTGVLYKKISKADVHEIMRELHYEKGEWFFTKESAAIKFAELSLYLTETVWGAAWNLVLNYYFSELLKQALHEHIITINDIHYGNDREVLQQLFNSSSKKIQNYLLLCRNVQNSFHIAKSNEYDFLLKPKFRGVDPYIKTELGLKRLTQLNAAYKDKFNSLRQICIEGYKIKLVR